MTDDVRTDGTVDEQHRQRDERPIEPRTGPVRIIGAQRAGGLADDEAAAEPPGAQQEPAGYGPEGWEPAEPALPHWTEAPTGEVPAILSRPGSGEEDDPWAAVPEPSWREEHADWDRADSLDAALWPGTGESQPSDEANAAEREPWSFELGPAAGGGELDEEEDDELFESWDDVAAASQSGWRETPRGNGASFEGLAEGGDELESPWGATGRSGPHRAGLESGGEGDQQAGLTWAPQDAPWDPDLVVGESTTVMRLPEPPLTEGTGHELPPPPVGYGGSGRYDVDEEALARHFAARAGHVASERSEPDMTETGGQSSDELLEDEALAADLEARRGRRRWPGRGDRGGRAATPATPAMAPSMALGAAPGGRARYDTAGSGARAGAASGAGTLGRAVAARRGEDAVSQRTGRNMPVAIASGLAIGALALVAFHFGTVPSMVVVTAVIGLAAVEAYAAFRRAGYHPATLLGLVAVVGLIVGSYDKTEQALPLVTVLLVAATFVWHLAGVDRRAEPVRSTAATLLVFCWVGVFGSFAALLLAPSLYPNRHGIAYLLGALIAAVAYDVGALAVGAWVGRHPLSAVSPGKTWEGVIGGAVAAIVLAVAVVHLIHPWTIGHSVLLGVVVAVVSPIGDLCESMVKRRLGLKDMGRILPGHGGLLDRVDGLLFVLPATFYLVRAFHG